MLAADAVAIVAIDQDIAPQHQRIAAALGEQAALERLVLVRGEGIDIGLEFFVDDYVHAYGRGHGKGGGIVEKPRRECLPR